MRVAEPVALATSGALVLATGWLRWISGGAGSTLNGFELADSLRHGALVPEGGQWAAAGLYLLVALGGLLLASSGFHGPLIAAIRLAVGLLVSALLGLVTAAGWFPLSRWSFGPMLVLFACVIAVAVSGGQLVRGRVGNSENSY